MVMFKMSKCAIIAPYINVTWNFLSAAHLDRGNESLYGFNLSLSSELTHPPPRRRVGQPVGGWLPSKSEKLRYLSLLLEPLKAEVSQSGVCIMI